MPLDPNQPQPQSVDSTTPAPIAPTVPAQSAGKSRRLRTEADKLAAFCLVVRAASEAADQAAFAEVGRAASKALRAKFGGGSITSAFAWVAGPSGQQALDSLVAGEVTLSGPLTLPQIVEAVALAQEAERLREKNESTPR